MPPSNDAAMGTFRLLWLLPLLAAAEALYPFGPDFDGQLPRGEDSSQEVRLDVPIKFYGQTYQSIYVNDNGLLSFQTDIPKFFNEPFPLEYPVIAPFYSNVDNRGAGTIYFRETREQEVLNIIAKKIADLYPTQYGFRPLAAFIVTWNRVGYYNSKSDKVNTFQAVVSSDGSESFVEFIYPENGITWLRAESIQSSVPDARGQVGVSSPGGKLAVIKGSGTDWLYNLPRWTNALSPGEYMFRVGNIEDTGQPEVPQTTIENEVPDESEPQSCTDGAILCHKYSDCFDEPEGGFCCRCQKGYFGDGRNCLDFETHRMIGKVNISLNGVESKNLNMQAFIVTGDGRTYTAITGVPHEIGYSMQLLVSLGSFVGFLFAKPIGDAPNGYQLTGGVVNHTLDISFGSNHHVNIRQRYTGLDLFEQIKMEAEVTGTIPTVIESARLAVLDFQEHYTRISPGFFRSQSRQTIEDTENYKESFDVFVDQTIEFKEYCPSAYKKLSSVRLKSSRHYLRYEPKDMILRLASTNKVSQNAEGQDPCIEGHVTCVANSSCLVEDDTFRCVCNPGFQTLPDQSSEFGCVDINECEDGSANCHSKALCVNEVGTYSCQCFPEYTGNGRQCEAIEPPKTPTLSNGFCRDYEHSYSCSCNNGFEKIPDGSEIGFTCEDIDECSITEPCDPSAECVNSIGSFTCYCPDGYVGDGYSCVKDEGDCENFECPTSSVCRETSNGPECVCETGYSGTPPNCSPIGVCEVDSDCKENFICQWNSTVQFSTCTCKEGYIQEQSSCLPPANENALVRTCMNGECWCPPGYIDNGQLCVPQTPSHSNHRHSSCKELNNCDKNARCIYVADKRDYECKCNAGYEGDGISCSEFEMSCHESPICDINAECRFESTSERYICICKEGYQGDGTTCYSMEEFSEPQCPQCHQYATCDSGTCTCIEGYMGDGIEICEKEIQGCDTLGNCSPQADCIYDPAEEGHRCRCHAGYEGDGYTCNEIITCHEHPDICSKDATCILAHETYTYNCQCNEGFFGNGSYCKAINKQEEEFLLLNKGRSTIRLPFQPFGRNMGIPIQMSGNQAIGIAIDCLEGRVYSSILNQKIKSFKYDGSDSKDFVISGVKSTEGLAIDWINRVLYWTESNPPTINSASLDDKQINNVITSGLDNPRGIAVHPQWRKIFWSDWYRRNPRIEMADLDGGNREVLVQSPHVKTPNSLAIDWDSNEICWADADLKRIECFDFLQRIERTVVQNCLYPFGLAITSDTYYWTDWSTRKVESSKKGSGTLTRSIPLPIGGDDKLYGLAAVTSTCPRI
ncbi:unnamed protein product [Nezara viridula]|uniref:Nidogen n=1 Tax=Nezara viridula TaxID=85310 RepID=A0A9P0H642_NEZVI|nr:unnamed protein product [Nezara viridula]